MPMLSVSKAAKLFSVSRPTLQKALKEGKLSGLKTEKDGIETWQIEQSELARLYPLRDPIPAKLPANDPEIGQPLAVDNLSENGDLSWQVIARLERELAVALAVAEERQRTIETLQEVVRQLPKPAPVADVQRKGLWAQLFGGQ